jgi:hypothetical protein
LNPKSVRGQPAAAKTRSTFSSAPQVRVGWPRAAAASRFDACDVLRRRPGISGDCTATPISALVGRTVTGKLGPRRGLFARVRGAVRMGQGLDVNPSNAARGPWVHYSVTIRPPGDKSVLGRTIGSKHHISRSIEIGAGSDEPNKSVSRRPASRLADGTLPPR